MDLYGGRRMGGWSEVTYEQVRGEIMKDVDPDYIERLESIANMAKQSFEDAHSSMVSLLAVLLESQSTPMLEDLNRRVSNIKGFTSVPEIISHMTPTCSVVSRDLKAWSQGFKSPPHIALESWDLSQLSPFDGLHKLSREAYTLLKYMEMHDLVEHKPASAGSKMFIGHGNSSIWRELKDFIADRLHLEWDEFNREAAAGLTVQERLRTMLDHAGFAFLLLTGEDQHANKTLHARENVIHELGLFQGRLGFRRAVVLLEESCSEFSNISGIIQIRFPKNNIGACFEEVRRVLEREGFLKQKDDAP